MDRLVASKLLQDEVCVQVGTRCGKSSISMTDYNINFCFFDLLLLLIINPKWEGNEGGGRWWVVDGGCGSLLSLHNYHHATIVPNKGFSARAKTQPLACTEGHTTDSDMMAERFMAQDLYVEPFWSYARKPNKGQICKSSSFICFFHQQQGCHPQFLKAVVLKLAESGEGTKARERQECLDKKQTKPPSSTNQYPSVLKKIHCKQNCDPQTGVFAWSLPNPSPVSKVEASNPAMLLEKVHRPSTQQSSNILWMVVQ